MWLPSINELKDIHEEVVELFINDGDPISPSGIKDTNLLEMSCMRPYTGIGKIEKYPSLRQKVAALFYSLNKNHAFHNGNKRTALVTLLTALDRNDVRLASKVTDELLYNFVVDVAANNFPRSEPANDAEKAVEEIGDWLSEHTQARQLKISSMRTVDFVRKCTDAGAYSRGGKGGTILIIKDKTSISISQATREISGPVVRQFLKKLGLSPNATGIDFEEFQDDTQQRSTRKQIHRYMSTLRRLAKT